ncbi:MAG: hypothetical protein ACI87N_001857 [Flavobacteriales bacterium]|jgi:hypothetical protein
MNTMRKNIKENPWINIGLLLALIIVFTIFTLSAPNLDKAGLGGLGNLVFPAIIGIITIVIYLISRIFTRKWNWIITICGIIFMACTSVWLFFI